MVPPGLRSKIRPKAKLGTRRDKATKSQYPASPWNLRPLEGSMTGKMGGDIVHGKLGLTNEIQVDVWNGNAGILTAPDLVGPIEWDYDFGIQFGPRVLSLEREN